MILMIRATSRLTRQELALGKVCGLGLLFFLFRPRLGAAHSLGDAGDHYTTENQAVASWKLFSRNNLKQASPTVLS